MSFGSRLRDLRKQKGLSQVDLARKIGASQGTITDYEREIKLPGSENLISIAKVFNVSLDYLLGLSTEKRSNPDLMDIINFTRPKINGQPMTDAQLDFIARTMENLVRMAQKEKD